MQVRAATALPPAYDPWIHVGGVPAIEGGTDTIATLLQQLATPQILEVLSQIEQPRLAQDPALMEHLLDTALTALAEHNVPRAMAAVRELITVNPERGAALVNAEPALAPIRHELKEMLQQITGHARVEAEHSLAAATLAAQTAGATPYVENVLAIAQRFIAAGELVNIVRATELSQAVLDYYSAPAAPAQLPLQRLAGLLQRAPLLILMVTWLLVGIAGWLLDLKATEIWAIGFLALVGFQFYASVRNARF